jgi:hypothetical protein
MERLLLHWIRDRQMRGDSTDGSTVCEKAKSIFDDFRSNQLNPRVPFLKTSGQGRAG